VCTFLGNPVRIIRAGFFIGGLFCSESAIGWLATAELLSCPEHKKFDMRKFHSIAAFCGDGLRPERKALFNRLAVDPHPELFVRTDGMV
jgi:hypothetical protein